jgi:hypothetical protein
MTAAFRHARYAPDTPSTDSSVDDENEGDDPVDVVNAEDGDETRP